MRGGGDGPDGDTIDIVASTSKLLFLEEGQHTDLHGATKTGSWAQRWTAPTQRSHVAPPRKR